MFHEESRGNMGVTLTPKASFILGLAAGLLVLCTIGFFILLTMTLRGGVSLGAAPQPSTNPTAQAPSVDPTAAAPIGDPKPVSASDKVTGAKNAVVTLIEYSDFQCPFCGQFYPTTQQVMKDYAGKIRLVLRHFPLSFHPEAIPAANAAECANEQGKFWEYADNLFLNQTSLASTYYPQVATKLGLNMTKFNSCFSAKKYQSIITADQTEGGSAGVNGTTGTFVLGPNGYKQYIAGAYPLAQVKAYIDAALAAKK